VWPNLAAIDNINSALAVSDVALLLLLLVAHSRDADAMACY